MMLKKTNTFCVLLKRNVLYSVMWDVSTERFLRIVPLLPHACLDYKTWHSTGNPQHDTGVSVLALGFASLFRRNTFKIARKRPDVSLTCWQWSCKMSEGRMAEGWVSAPLLPGILVQCGSSFVAPHHASWLRLGNIFYCWQTNKYSSGS